MGLRPNWVQTLNSNSHTVTMITRIELRKIEKLAKVKGSLLEITLFLNSGQWTDTYTDRYKDFYTFNVYR